MIDVLVTTRNRVDMLKRTLAGIDRTTRIPYRLFVADDASTDGTQTFLAGYAAPGFAGAVLGKERRGVVYNFNALWALADYHDSFMESYPYMAYIQDDMDSAEENWLAKLIGIYEAMRDAYNIGFFSGYQAPEHPVDKVVQFEGRNIYLKKSAPASCLIAEKRFWRSIGYVPKLNPDGSVRGMPDKHRGSHIDVYLTGCCSGSRFSAGAAAPSCSYSQGKTLLVVPGMLEHMAREEQKSTWRNPANVVR